MPSIPVPLLGALVPLGVQLVVFLRWMHRRMRDDEIHRAFVRDMAVHHLPRIYSILREVAAQQGIVLEETPIVRFLDLERDHPAA